MKEWLKKQFEITRRVRRLMAALCGVALMIPLMAAEQRTNWAGLMDVYVAKNPNNSTSLGLICFTNGYNGMIPTEVTTTAGAEFQTGTKLRANSGSTVDIYSTATLKSGSEINENSGGLHIVGLSAQALTTPGATATSFPATGLYGVELTSNYNATGVHPTGGRTGQLLMITTGAGSNTMAFSDDATSMTIGGTITLTEGQNDFLTLRCVQAPAASNGYGQWAAVSAHDN